jgi:hypothetical protein
VVLAVAVYRAKLGAEETQGEIDTLKARKPLRSARTLR